MSERDEHVEDLETIELPDGARVTVDHNAAAVHVASGAIPADVWAQMLKHMKEHGL
jgi:hypothetical protein